MEEKMKRVEISIILPAFNAEEYIDECITSIKKQSFRDWELIVVDDGSQDGTLEICKKSSDDERIQVFHTENRGVSEARNFGLSKATGEYIVFVDADDYLTDNSLQVRIDLIKDSDLGIAGYKIIDDGNTISQMPLVVNQIWDKHEAIKNIIVPGEIGYQGYSVNKIFKRDIIQENGISFDGKVCFNEDRLFCISYALCCEKVHLTNDLVYVYRRNRSSAMASLKKMTDNNMTKYLSAFEAFDQIMDLIKNEYPDCYYTALKYAQGAAIRQKRMVDKSQKKLRKRFNLLIIKYGLKAMSAPRNILNSFGKMKIAYHMMFFK